MGNSIPIQNEQEIRAHTSLLRSHMKRQMNLNHQIELENINLMYKYNSDYMLIKKTTSSIRGISSNLQKVIKQAKSIKSLEYTKATSAGLQNIMIRNGLIQSENENEKIMMDIIENQEKNNKLKEKLKNLQEKLVEKQQIYYKNKEKAAEKISADSIINLKILEIEEKKETLKLIESSQNIIEETLEKDAPIKKKSVGLDTTNESLHLKRISSGIRSDLDFFSFEAELTNSIRNEMHLKISERLENTKKCLFLSQNALNLKSKLQLKRKVEKKIKPLRKEIKEG